MDSNPDAISRTTNLLETTIVISSVMRLAAAGSDTAKPNVYAEHLLLLSMP